MPMAARVRAGNSTGLGLMFGLSASHSALPTQHSKACANIPLESAHLTTFGLLLDQSERSSNPASESARRCRRTGTVRRAARIRPTVVASGLERGAGVLRWRSRRADASNRAGPDRADPTGGLPRRWIQRLPRLGQQVGRDLAVGLITRPYQRRVRRIRHWPGLPGALLRQARPCDPSILGRFGTRVLDRSDIRSTTGDRDGLSEPGPSPNESGRAGCKHHPSGNHLVRRDPGDRVRPAPH